MCRARLIAFYLPQFHPIPENDEWWGKGFTEWTNVAKAKPLFAGHYQPRLPADLGFYDLRVPEVREAQATLARNAGIEGFCYWHYWFAGRRLLERPFNEVIESRKPDFPFCLAWANDSWRGTWYGAGKNRLLIEQTYPGVEDYEQHFLALLDAFKDPRYIRVRNKPLFVIFRPTSLPQPEQFIALWQKLALRNGLPGIHFVAHLFGHDGDYPWKNIGYGGAVMTNELKLMRQRWWQVVAARFHMPSPEAVSEGCFKRALGAGACAARLFRRRLLQRLFRWPGAVHDYADAMLFLNSSKAMAAGCYPSIVPGWDNSARAGRNGVILHGATPELFFCHARNVVDSVKERESEDRIVFVKSWNEWAEGNYLEPDQRYGHGFLEALRRAVDAEKRGA